MSHCKHSSTRGISLVYVERASIIGDPAHVFLASLVIAAQIRIDSDRSDTHYHFVLSATQCLLLASHHVNAGVLRIFRFMMSSTDYLVVHVALGLKSGVSIVPSFT